MVMWKMPMVMVTNEVLQSLDQIFYSGSKGTHLLFSTGAIRDAFARHHDFEKFDLDLVAEQLHSVLAELLWIDDLEDRRQFIDALDTTLRDMLVHLYFGFLDHYQTEDEPPEVLH